MNRQFRKMETLLSQTMDNQPNNPEQTLTQEQKVNLENSKKIMSSE